MNDKKSLYEWLNQNVNAKEDFSNTLYEWLDMYEYKYKIENNSLYLEDLQDKDVPIKQFECKDFIRHWRSIIDCKILSADWSVALVWYPFVRECCEMLGEDYVSREGMDIYIKNAYKTDGKIDIKELCWELRYKYDSIEFIESGYPDFKGDVIYGLTYGINNYYLLTLYFNMNDNKYYMEMLDVVNDELKRQRDEICNNYSEISNVWTEWIKS